jgi:hypothetical protein
MPQLMPVMGVGEQYIENAVKDLMHHLQWKPMSSSD